MRKKRKELTRTAAMFLASLLTVNSIDLPAFTADGTYVAYAAQAEDVPEITEHKAVAAVTSFAGLEESIANQQLTVGAGEEHISLASEVECGDFIVSSEGEQGTDYEYEDGVLYIYTAKKITIKNKDDLTSTTDRIVIYGWDEEGWGGAGANITLAGVNIDVSDQSNAAVLVKETAGTVNITLDEGTTNVLKSGGDKSGLVGEYGDEIVIVIDGSGNLESFGCGYGYGIEVAGTLEIKGGIITATGGGKGGGIAGKEIIIKGGCVTATGYFQRAGITGYGRSKATIKISGGYVVANGGDYGAGIGGNVADDGDMINISGGTIIAKGGTQAAGIGGGYDGAGGTVVITGGNIRATGGEDAEDIGHGIFITDSGTLKDGSGNDLSLHTITLCGLTAETEVSSISGVDYSMKDVKTLDKDKLYLYLPASAEVTGVNVGTQSYIGKLIGITTKSGTYHPYTITKEDNVTIQAYCDSCKEVPTVTLATPDSNIYIGEAIEAKVTENPKDKIPYVVDYSAIVGELTNGKPVNVGKYRASITLGEQTISIDYKIKKIPQATDFIFKEPDDLTYNPAGTQATVTTECSGMGDITLTYYKVADGKLSPVDGIPKYIGTYQVAVSVAEGSNYKASAEEMTSDAWRYTISKAECPRKMPASTQNVPYSCKTVGAVELPEGWEWGIYQNGNETIDKTTALEVDVPVKAVAVYNGADKGNYITERAEITIIRLACEHKEGEILYTGIGEHAPDCVNSGLGHTECTKCHEVMRDGISVPELGHNYESEVTTAPTTTSTGVRTYTCKNCGDSYTEIIAKLREEAKEPTVGKKYKDDKGKAYYTVTSNAKNARTVTYSAPLNKKVTSVTIPATVKISGVSYKVTAIKKNAFKNCKKLAKVTIGSNIRSIGANAFYGCKKLKTLTVKTTKLTSKKVGKKAFNKTPKSMTVKVPKKMLGKYKKLFVKKGVSKKAKFKKL